MQAEREAKARATILEMVGDIPDADIAPPENVLFVCKLNPVTTDDDLEIIFSRFGKIKSCEVIRDRKTGDSLQYAFIEFENQKSCEDAYFKMANVLIDDRRIHVDFSQSVSKVKWLGKGRVTHYDEKGNRSKNGGNRDIGKGNYKLDRKRRDSPLEDKRQKKSRSPQRSRAGDNFRRDYKDSRRRESPDRRQHRRTFNEEQHLSRRRQERNGRSPRRFRSPRRRSRSRRRYSPHRSSEKRHKSRDDKHSEVVQRRSDRKPKNKRSGSTSSSEDESETRSKRDKKPTKVEKKVGRAKKQSSKSSSTESDSSSEDHRSKKEKTG